MLASGIKRYTVIRSHTLTEELRLPNVKKIVLAEDDDDDFHLFNSAILSIYSSIEILRTKNGIVFSSLMETSLKPDFIILDINMPLKDGITCLKEIKSKAHFDDCKVVMYSTSGVKKEIDLCYKYGADFYLVKPLTYNSIIDQLKELFCNEYFIGQQRPPQHKFVFKNDWLYHN